VHADTVDEVVAAVTRWLADPAARERVRESQARLARPAAAEAIARRVLNDLGRAG